MELKFGEEQLDLLFPFHIVLNKEWQVLQVGSSLKRIYPSLSQNTSIKDHCSLRGTVKHDDPWDLDHLTQRLLLVEIQGTEIVLRGQIIECEKDSLLLFIGSPWVRDTSTMRILDLSISDFAVHDPTIDFVLVVQASQMALKESKELAEELDEQRSIAIEARTMAEKANEEKSTFLANISHEIRTPLHNILAITSLLDTRSMDEAQCRDIDLIRSSSESLLGLLNNVLDLSKLEAGYIEPYNEDFSLRELLYNALGPLRWNADQKGLVFEIALSPQMPEMIYGDMGKLRQIIVNLVNNAVKFTETGLVKVSADTSVSDASVELRIEVLDTGIGISADQRESIFQAFTQASASTNRKYGGTGLGLSICSHLAALVGGRIELESELGKGSVFSFVCRYDLPQNSNEAMPEVLAHTQSPELRILLAEDNATSRLVAQRILERKGFFVSLAENGKQALDSHAQQEFDLVLMDVQMPIVDGLAATRKIREREQSKHRVPIIALTANATSEDRNKCAAAGMDDYLAKPFSADDLYEVLGRWLSIPKIEEI